MALWTPADYTGSDRYAWLRLKNTGAATASALTLEGGKVRTVACKWGLNDFTAPEPSENWHTVPLGLLNGHQALDFTNGDHHLNGPEITSAYTGTVTLIALGLREEDAGGNRGVIGSKNNYFGLTTEVYEGGSPRGKQRFRGGFNGSEYWNFTPDDPIVGVITFDNAGNETISGDGHPPTVWNTNAHSIGGGGDCWQIGRWANGETHLGKWGEGFIFHGIPSSADIDRFVGYLIWDWYAAGTRLPTLHEYKLAAPTTGGAPVTSDGTRAATTDAPSTVALGQAYRTGARSGTTELPTATRTGAARGTGTGAQTTAAPAITQAGSIGRATGTASRTTDAATATRTGTQRASGARSGTSTAPTMAAVGVGRATGTQTGTTAPAAMVALGQAAQGVPVGLRTAETAPAAMVATGAASVVGSSVQTAPAPAMDASGVAWADGYKNSLTNTPTADRTGASRADGTRATVTAEPTLEAQGYTVTTPAMGTRTGTTAQPTMDAHGEVTATGNVVRITDAPSYVARGNAAASGAVERETAAPSHTATAVTFVVGLSSQLTVRPERDARGLAYANGNSSQITAAPAMVARARSNKITGSAALMLGV